MTVAAAAVVAGLLIGGILGALGGGGAILAVPALVYLLGQSARDATTGSLFIVGATAAVGVLSHARSGNVHWGTGAAFSAAGVAAAVAGTAVNRYLPQDLLLLAFATLMVVVAVGMLRHSRQTPAAEPTPPPTAKRPRTAIAARTVAAGSGVGFLTGLLGVGGGFIVVPALVFAGGLAMPAAVGTSLFVIAVNCAVSLSARIGFAGPSHLDWTVIAPFTAAAMLATLAGKHLADHLPTTLTTRAFAILTLLTATLTFLA